MLFIQLFRKILSGMANSVNLDRTLKEQSDLSLHCVYMPFVRNFGVLFSDLSRNKKRNHLGLTKAGLTSGLVLNS